MVGQRDRGTEVGEPCGPVMGRKWPLHEVRLLKATAGAPATMPSKSPGKVCADLRPWRPPVEQPR